MTTIQREPAMALGGVAAAVNAALALLVYRGTIDLTEAGLWGALATAVLAVVVPVAQAVVTRGLVVPVETIREAGLSPDDVRRAADDPRVTYREG